MDLSALVAVGLVVGALMLGHRPVLARRGDRPGDDPPGDDSPGDDSPGDDPWSGVRVSVVVPARDEAETLPTLLASLRALDPPPAEVIVVDDSSTDATARVAADHGARVVASSPPEGWAGKPWACHVGAEAATGTHLLFLDADTWLAPDALDRLVLDHHRAGGGGLLSVQPHHRAAGGYEQLSAFFNLTAMMGTGAFAVGRRTSGRMAFGPCLLTTVDDYRAAGGHAAVRGEVVEDVRLARRYAARDLPVRCVAGDDAVAFRMYPAGVGQLVEGWTKNIAAGAGLSPRWALVATVAWVSSCVAVAVGALDAVVAGSGGEIRGAAGAWAVVAAELWWLLRRVGTWRLWTVVAFPVPLAAFLVVFLRSLVVTALGRDVTWRSRRVPVSARTARPARPES